MHINIMNIQKPTIQLKNLLETSLEMTLFLSCFIPNLLPKEVTVTLNCFLFLFVLREREIKSKGEGEKERERKRESYADSVPNIEPESGLSRTILRS